LSPRGIEQGFHSTEPHRRHSQGPQILGLLHAANPTGVSVNSTVHIIHAV